MSSLISFCSLFCWIIHASITEAAKSDDDHYFKFVSRPDIGAPKWDIEVYDEDALAPGYWFVAPYAKLEQNSFDLWNGPHIYDQTGELIWSGAPFLKHYNTHDFRVAEVQGEPMLTAIVPHDTGKSNGNRISFQGHGNGDGVIFGSDYNVYDTINIRWDNPLPNMHDLTVFDDGRRALMLTQKTYEPRPVQIGHFNVSCHVGYQGFRETNLETNEIVFEWQAEGHVDPFESTKQEGETGTYVDMCKNEWDILHFNSVDKFDDGDYLLCARHTNTIYKISHKDGSIVWRLGGTKSDFKFLDEAAKFTRQHHGKFRSQNETHTLISLFNNAKGSGPYDGDMATSEESAGLLLALRTDVQPMTAELVARWSHPEGKLSPSRGSLSFLDNGNVFLCWVYQSLISEHTLDGRLLFKARLGPGENTYRAYKYPWVGQPAKPPDVVSTALQNEQERLTTLVHVSWNGATEVATWELLHTTAASDVFETIATISKQGFETRLSYDGFAEYVVVIALDREGREIGRSEAIKTALPSDPLDVSIAEETKWQQDHSTEAQSHDNTQLVPPLPEALTTEASDAWSSKSLPSGYAAFTFGLGFGCCLVLSASIWLVVRARSRSSRGGSWWRSSRTAYKALSENGDEDMEQDEHMLNDKDAP